VGLGLAGGLFDYVSDAASAAGYARGLKDSVARTVLAGIEGAIDVWNDPVGALGAAENGLLAVPNQHNAGGIHTIRDQLPFDNF